MTFQKISVIHFKDMLVSKRYFYLLVVLFLFNLVIFVGYLHVLYQTDGTWVYPLDDTYIHMQIAKNIAEQGYYGYTNYDFCSSSSSPLYTFVLAICNKLFGMSVLAPLILNVIFANVLVVVLFFFLKKRIIPFLLMTLFLFSPVLLPVQVFSGMEHTMHILLIITAYILIYNLINNNYTGKSKKALVMMCLFLCLTRYESMFFIVSLSFLLFLNKQYKLSVVIFLSGFLPVVLFGLFSLYHGGWFFPNSLLLKGNIDIDSNPFVLVFHYLSRILSYLRSTILGLPLLLLLSFVVYDFRKRKMKYNEFIGTYSLIGVVLITIILHLMFASFGLLFRYEAYLHTLLYLTIVLTFLNPDESFTFYSFKMMLKRKVVSFVLLPLIMILCLGIVYRAVAATRLVYYASKNVYDQQIQMASFLKRYYNRAGVMANDVGAIQYFTNIKLLDLIGLTSNEICQLRLSLGNDWNLESYINAHPQTLKEYPLIMVYDKWFDISTKSDYERLGWIKTGELCIPNNFVCGDSNVSFYTSNRDEVKPMVVSLKEFKKDLPEGVILIVYE